MKIGTVKNDLQKRAVMLERGRSSEQKYEENVPNLIINHVMWINLLAPELYF